MPTESLIIIFLITIALILGVSLVIVILDLFKLEKRLKKAEEENNGYKTALQKEADIVLDEANKRAMHIIDEANRKSMEIVSSSQSYSAESQKALKENLQAITKAESDQIQKVGNEVLTTYQGALEAIHKEGNEVVQSISKDLEKHASEEIAGFTEAVRQGTLESQKVIQERLDAEYKQAEQDVARYKETQMKKVQDEIFTLVRYMTEVVLGKGLTIEQHQTLVTQALQEAKAQGVIK